MFENSKMLERVSGQEAVCNVTPVSEIEKSRREEKERNLGSYSYSIKLEENRLMVSLSYQSLINQSCAQSFSQTDCQLYGQSDSGFARS